MRPTKWTDCSTLFYTDSEGQRWVSITWNSLYFKVRNSINCGFAGMEWTFRGVFRASCRFHVKNVNLIYRGQVVCCPWSNPKRTRYILSELYQQRASSLVTSMTRQSYSSLIDSPGYDFVFIISSLFSLILAFIDCLSFLLYYTYLLWQPPHYVEDIWKRSFIPTVRPTVGYTNTLFKPEKSDFPVISLTEFSLNTYPEWPVIIIAFLPKLLRRSVQWTENIWCVFRVMLLWGSVNGALRLFMC